MKEGPQPAEEAIGSGLGSGLHRMRKTEYNVGFAKDGSQSPSKVLRTWSRPVLEDETPKSYTQVCTCQKFRKRIRDDAQKELSI